ncbi:cyclin-K-like isoform X2 [Triticum urartu]|uniref:cyclin-K-like isoform X2 n=1 Tax=Triticum urartu TaxID=4572 RepID=UPI002043F10D|nr:cyclin-K-like isoform X2 [Triticum urartu]
MAPPPPPRRRMPPSSPAKPDDASLPHVAGRRLLSLPRRTLPPSQIPPPPATQPAPWMSPCTRFMSCFLSTAAYMQFNAATIGCSISPSWTRPSTSWLPLIPVWPGRLGLPPLRSAVQPGGPRPFTVAAPRPTVLSHLPPHLGLPYASPTPAGKYGGLLMRTSIPLLHPQPLLLYILDQLLELAHANSIIRA